RRPCWWPTTAEGWPPSPGSGPPWPACRPGSRWSGTPIPAARPRAPAPAWPPRTGPRRPGSPPRSVATAWPRSRPGPAPWPGGGRPPGPPPPSAPPAPPPCGAGARSPPPPAALLADGALPSEAVAGAVAAASAFVATGAAATIHLPSSTPGAPDPTFPPPASPLDRARPLIAAARARGGTVVAPGGCFDLLHAGHVATLRAARALGDCLLVCLNSDGSVRRLKGPGGPLMRLGGRARGGGG